MVWFSVWMVELVESRVEKTVLKPVWSMDGWTDGS